MTRVRNAAKGKTRAVKSNATKGKQRNATYVPEESSKAPTSTRGVGKATEGTRKVVKSIQEERTLKSGRTTRQQKSMTIEYSVPTGRASAVVQVSRSSAPGDDFTEPAVEEEEGPGDEESQVSQSGDKQKCDATAGDGGHGHDTFPVIDTEPASGISNEPASRTSGEGQGHCAPASGDESALEQNATATRPHSEAEGEEESEDSFVAGHFQRDDITLIVSSGTQVIPSWMYSLPRELANFDWQQAPGLKKAVMGETIPLLRETEISTVTAGPGKQGVAAIRGESVSLDNFQRLLNSGAWLSDDIVNFYLRLLENRDTELCGRDPARKRSYFFNSHFMTKLLGVQTNGSISGYNYEAAKTSAARELASVLSDANGNSPEAVFFPIHIVNHWAMVLAHLGQKRIAFFDSREDKGGKKGSKYTNHVFHFLQDLFRDHGLVFPDPKSWTLFSATSIDHQHQKNGTCAPVSWSCSCPN
jgi:Ulp1 protease family, C-terminal catalytic domain